MCVVGEGGLVCERERERGRGTEGGKGGGQVHVCGTDFGTTSFPKDIIRCTVMQI